VPSHALTGDQARAVNKAKRRAALRGLVRLLPPLFLVILFVSTMGHGSAEHANKLYYILGILLVAAATAAVIGIARIGRRCSLTFTRPTPRWLYLLFLLCYAAPAAALFWLASEHPGAPHGQDWVQMMYGLISCTCAVAALMMLGRAMATRDSRLVFYLYVPLWLQALPAQELSGPDRPAGTGWAAQPRPIHRGLPASLPPRQRSGSFEDAARREWPPR
jgi:hypothetical protein